MQMLADKTGDVSLRGEGILGRAGGLNRDNDVCDRVQQQGQTMGFALPFQEMPKILMKS